MVRRRWGSRLLHLANDNVSDCLRLRAGAAEVNCLDHRREGAKGFGCGVPLEAAIVNFLDTWLQQVVRRAIGKAPDRALSMAVERFAWVALKAKVKPKNFSQDAFIASSKRRTMSPLSADAKQYAAGRKDCDRLLPRELQARVVTPAVMRVNPP